MWKALSNASTPKNELELEPYRVSRSAIRRKNGRSRPLVADDLQKVIVEAAARLFYRERIESVSLAQLAEHVGLRKGRIYRIFGSREAFVQAYADWLCERERARWQEAEHRSGEEPVQHLRELFIDLAAEMVSDGYRGGQLQMLAMQFNDEGHPIRLLRSNHGRAFRALLMRLAVASNAADAEGLTDTLMTLWEGATCNFQSSSESRRVAQRLPTLADHVIRSYVQGCLDL
jgi:AcrR family transcriptional regulator